MILVLAILLQAQVTTCNTIGGQTTCRTGPDPYAGSAMSTFERARDSAADRYQPEPAVPIYAPRPAPQAVAPAPPPADAYLRDAVNLLASGQCRAALSLAMDHGDGEMTHVALAFKNCKDGTPNT